MSENTRLPDISIDAFRDAVRAFGQARLHTDAVEQRHALLPENARLSLPFCLELDGAYEAELAVADVVGAALDRVTIAAEVEAVIADARALRVEHDRVDLQIDVLERGLAAWARRLRGESRSRSDGLA